MFSKVLCISLPARTDRRAHAVEELGRMGLTPFDWIHAFGRASKSVARAFSQDRVAAFPPCFRCGAERCDCENRRLMPEQVGTWLSHEEAWRRVAREGMTLICEDDVKFTERTAEGLAWLAAETELSDALAREQPVLLRLGRALDSGHESPAGFTLTRSPSMSNPCYAMNRPMADRLLANSGRISTTVDIFTHVNMASRASQFTLEPPLAYELSWSTGELRSDIRPKQVFLERQRALLSRLDPSDERYQTVLDLIEAEEARFDAFEAYNSPEGQES
jgi:GR25 family glycosyltransferase involved in LPS biosynthesis